ncbi:MAG: hypothetical protein E7488_02705 [Ruminococcaceae bacterium]|nr:hypothetical protein [Oscillospiraceae bacterium]
MEKYSEKNLLRVAKRYNNKKRSFLLVNPLQAKHIPVAPSESLKMMECLGDKLAKKYSDARLVIAFAETATAIGAVVAQKLSEKCVYITTTRENVDTVKEWVEFQEEHSHAVQQKLAADKLESYINNTDCIIIVDDEFSTGKTLINIVNQLKEKYPAVKDKKLVAASVLNRVSDENNILLQDNGISTEFLVKLENKDYVEMIDSVPVYAAEEIGDVPQYANADIFRVEWQENARTGVSAVEYGEYCRNVAERIYSHIAPQINKKDRILVAGTEEFMYPAIVTGRIFEGKGFEVKTHSTTRSPIGVYKTEGYPVFNGFRLSSFYEHDRATYIYDTQKYDVIIVVSDTTLIDTTAFSQLLCAFGADDTVKAFYINGGMNVQYI